MSLPFVTGIDLPAIENTPAPPELSVALGRRRYLATVIRDNAGTSSLPSFKTRAKSLTVPSWPVSTSLCPIARALSASAGTGLRKLSALRVLPTTVEFTALVLAAIGRIMFPAAFIEAANPASSGEVSEKRTSNTITRVLDCARISTSRA